MTGEKYITVESLSASYAIIWGLFIANPLIDSFTRNPKLYAPMRELVIYESFWGMLFGGGGSLALYLALTNSRAKASTVNFIIFTAFAMFLFVGDAASPGWSLLGLIVVWNFIHWRSLKWKSAKV